MNVGSIPGQGTKIPYATGQLSLCATNTVCMSQLRPKINKTFFKKGYEEGT